MNSKQNTTKTKTRAEKKADKQSKEFARILNELSAKVTLDLKKRWFASWKAMVMALAEDSRLNPNHHAVKRKDPPEKQAAQMLPKYGRQYLRARRAILAIMDESQERQAMEAQNG